MLGDVVDVITFALLFAMMGGTIVAAALSRTPWSVGFLKYWVIGVLAILGLALGGRCSARSPAIRCAGVCGMRRAAERCNLVSSSFCDYAT